MKTDSNIELSVVVLCYRADKHIKPFFEKLKTSLESESDALEFVLVANYIEGSDDQTPKYVQALAKEDPRIKTVVEPKSGMMGWDMRKGLMAASGQYICVIDGDGQFPIETISECFQLIKKEQLDLVKTFRKKRGDGFYRKLISKVYNLLFRILFPGIGSSDANSKPKILRRAALDKLELASNDWFIDAEIMINVRRQKMKYKEIPTEFFEIENRKSFVKPSAIFEFVKNLIAYRIREWRK